MCATALLTRKAVKALDAVHPALGKQWTGMSITDKTCELKFVGPKAAELRLAVCACGGSSDGEHKQHVKGQLVDLATRKPVGAVSAAELLGRYVVGFGHLPLLLSGGRVAQMTGLKLDTGRYLVAAAADGRLRAGHFVVL